jgi:CYTH domain-containing protein
VRLEETKAMLLLRISGPKGDVEEQTEVPLAHAHALLDVCAGEVDYTRTKLSIGDHVAMIDHLIRPHALHLVTVEFDNVEEARGFDPLSWFGPELAADSRFNYQALALRGLSEALDVLLSDAALESLLDTLENCFVARSRVAMNRSPGKLVPETKTQVAASAQANAHETKLDLTNIEAAMMREMERTLQKSRT